tara:strand:+ start:78 stop:527 length:450 start_codon:yes stop_codon:yes gene_type:complete
MIITCPSCNKKFEVDASLIPMEGKLLQCGACSHKWFFKKETKKKIINDAKKSVDKIPEISDKNIPDNTEDLIAEAETAISKTTKKQIKNKKINILSFLIVLIISFVALIILADTFKNSIKLLIPGFDLILNSLYETLKDVILFIKDLFN